MNSQINNVVDSSESELPVSEEANTGEGGESLQDLASRLVKQAGDDGVSLVGPGGLLSGLTKGVLETALDAELTEHLGYEANERTMIGNSRNGMRSKTVVTDIGPVEIDVPRDRESSFEPKIVRKRQRRLDGVDGIVCSLSAKGLTHGEISAISRRSMARRCLKKRSVESPTRS